MLYIILRKVFNLNIYINQIFNTPFTKAFDLIFFNLEPVRLLLFFFSKPIRNALMFQKSMVYAAVIAVKTIK